MNRVQEESFAAKRLRQAQEYARKDFETHTITRVRFGVWRCATPGTLINHFYVTFSPGALMVHGDIGEIMFVPRKPSALRWAKGVFRPDYIEYPFQKLSRQIKADEYSKEVACENAEYLIGEEEDPKIKAEMKEVWDFTDPENSSDYYEFIGQFCDDYDGLAARAWTFRTLLVYQALCWFMQHVSSKDERFKEELAS